MLKPSTFLPRMLWMGLIYLSGCGDGSAAAPTGDAAVDAGVPSDTTDVANSRPPGPLGAPCTTDEDCEAGSWCSTVPGFERCAPRLFENEAHQMDFVFVPSGTFRQGTLSATDEERPYRATLTRNYFVGRSEVTQGQWTAATGGTNRSYFQDTTCTNGNCASTENANPLGPVERIDWYAALAYANWLSSENGLQPCYKLFGCSSPVGWYEGIHSECTRATFEGLDCTGYRLLTESEWERAARGGTTNTYHWGDANDTMTVGQNAWFVGNSGDRTQAVGQKLMNPYGLYDMSGNVGEWVWDPWASEYPSASSTDYIGPPTSLYRAGRGGSWNSSPSFLRSAFRGGDEPFVRHIGLGFRLARTVP